MLTTIAVAAVALVAGTVLVWFLSARTRGEMTDTCAAVAQQAFMNVGESLVQLSKTQIDGSLDTKKAEIDTMLKPLRDMLEQYRGEVVKSERSRNEAYG